MKNAFAISAFIIGSIAACSHTETSQKNLHRVEQVEMSSLHVRRPSGPGADVDVGPGGVDFRSNPPPDENFDCKKVSSLFASLRLDALTACMSSLEKPVELFYSLRRSAEPAWVLKSSDQAPLCLREILGEIPVPREIVFRNRERDCYTSRVDMEADEVLGFKVPKNQVELKISFPPEQTESKADLMRRIGSWALTPFWNRELNAIPSRLLPEHLCRVCVEQPDPEKDLPDEMRTYWP